MNLIDLIAGIWIASHSMFGARRGFSEQLMRLMPWWAGVLVTIGLTPTVFDAIETIAPSLEGRSSGLILSLAISYGVVYLIARTFLAWIEKIALGSSATRTLGAVLGALEGIVGVVFVVAMLWLADLTHIKIIQQSQVAAAMIPMFHGLSQQYVWSTIHSRPQWIWRTLWG